MDIIFFTASDLRIFFTANLRALLLLIYIISNKDNIAYIVSLELRTGSFCIAGVIYNINLSFV